MNLPLITYAVPFLIWLVLGAAYRILSHYDYEQYGRMYIRTVITGVVLGTAAPVWWLLWSASIEDLLAKKVTVCVAFIVGYLAMKRMMRSPFP